MLHSNPFHLNIIPELFIGYKYQIEQFLTFLKRGDKFCLISGPSGSGKTTMMKFLCQKRLFENGQRWKTLYIPKPPINPEEWIKIFKKIVWFLHSDLYTLHDKINKKLKKPCLILIDEADEVQPNCLEWLRVISEQVSNIFVVFAARSELSPNIKNRISMNIKLEGLSRAEIGELIKKRIEFYNQKLTFCQDALDIIYALTKGLPRDVLKMCSQIVQKSNEMGITTIDFALLQEIGYTFDIENLSKKQKAVLALLAQKQGLTPTQLLSLFNPGYKDTGNGIRALNNLLKRLATNGFVERQKIGKAYKYIVCNQIKFLIEQRMMADQNKFLMPQKEFK
jgi:type II secretory pathway predicted ATPase ExeA